MQADQRAEQARQALAAAGTRRTVARQLVIDTLAASPVHLSIGAIHERVAAVHPEINISTIHRTVALLAAHGLVHVLPWPGEALYGLAGEPHVHAVCEVCGTMSEIPARAVARAVAQAGTATQYQIGFAGLALFGRCPACQEKRPGARTSTSTTGASRPGSGGTPSSWL